MIYSKANEINIKLEDEILNKYDYNMYNQDYNRDNQEVERNFFANPVSIKDN